MKKLLLIASIALVSFTRVSNNVYVCMSDTSVAYHSTSSCRGLEKCTHTIKKIDESDAKKLGKRRCKLCW